MFLQPTIIDGDWNSVRQAIQKISVFKTGSSSESEFSKLTIDNLSGILKAVSGAVNAISDGSADQYLKTNGSGSYSWSDVSGVGEITLLDGGDSTLFTDTLIFDADSSVIL